MAYDKGDELGKERVTITLDSDVVAGVRAIAKAQRDSLSGMANRMLATVLGLVPRQADRAKDAEGPKMP